MKYRLALSAVIVVIVAVIAVYFSLNGRHQPTNANAASVTQPAMPPSANANTAVVVESKAPVPRQPGSKGKANDAALYAIAVPMQTVINADYAWRIRHGYSLGMYAGYDNDTIEKMAKNGDPLAQSVWFERVTKGNSLILVGSPGPAKALQIHTRYYQIANAAILNGATNPDLVTTFVTANPKLLRSNEQRAAADQSPAELLQSIKAGASINAAVAVFSEMRGDPSSPRGGNRVVSATYHAALDYLAGMNPLPDPQASAEIIAKACSVARDYYDQAQAERTAKGLGEFDNTPPKYVIGSHNPFPAVALCQDEWPGPAPKCTPVWVQSATLVDGSPAPVAGWECHLEED